MQVRAATFLAAGPAALSRAALHSLATLTQHQRERRGSQDPTAGAAAAAAAAAAVIVGAAGSSFLSALGAATRATRASGAGAGVGAGALEAGGELLDLAWERLGEADLDGLIALFARPEGVRVVRGL